MTRIKPLPFPPPPQHDIRMPLLIVGTLALTLVVTYAALFAYVWRTVYGCP